MSIFLIFLILPMWATAGTVLAYIYVNSLRMRSGEFLGSIDWFMILIVGIIAGPFTFILFIIG